MHTCSYCFATAPNDGEFLNCGCVGRSLFKCGDRPTCTKCQQAHAKLAKFFDSLLNSKQAIRADSIRSKYFSILFDVACDFRRDLRNVNKRAFSDCGVAIEALKNISIFDSDERTFQTSLRRALPCLPLNSQFKAEFAKRLAKWDAQRKIDSAAQAVTAALVDAAEKENIVNGLAGLIREQQLTDRLAKLAPQTPSLASDTSLARQLEALVTAAMA